MKVQIFSGRVHHWIKLKNLYEGLESNGHDVEFLITNNAINIDPPAEYMLHSGFKYNHAYDYVNSVKNSYFHAPENVSKYIPPFWQVYSQRELFEFANGVQNMWKQNGKPDVVLILHANNFWTKMLAYLCQQNGIAVYAFQEGLLRKRDQQTLNKQASSVDYCNGIFVWSENERKQYIEAGIDESQIVVSGPVHLDRKYHPQRITGKNPMVLLAIPSVNEYIGDWQKDVKAIANYCQDNGFELMFRPHPFEKHLVSHLPSGVAYDVNDDALPVLVNARLVLGQHSTIVLEAVLLGIPAMEYNFSGKTLTEPLSSLGLADYIGSIGDLSKIEGSIRYGKSDVNVSALNSFRVPLDNVVKSIVEYLESKHD